MTRPAAPRHAGVEARSAGGGTRGARRAPSAPVVDRAERPSARTGASGSVLVLTLTHPDFLPSLYSLTQVLRDEGYRVDVITSASPVGASVDPGPGVAMHECGAYGGTSLERWRARRRFARVAARRAATDWPAAIIATCPFTYLAALRLARRRIPVVYYYFEFYDFRMRDLAASPLDAIRNWRALRHLDEAGLVIAPSYERAAWIAGRARLERMPDTVLNSGYARGGTEPPDAAEIERVLPAHFRGRTLVVNTGAVTDNRAVRELVESVADWPDDACLAVTNVGDSGYAAEVRRAAALSPRGDDILLLPPVRRRTMLALQARASIGVCLLRPHAWIDTILPAPNKVGEYVLAGLLVLGNRIPYLELVEARGAAILADSVAPPDIAAAVAAGVARAAAGDTRELVREVARSWYCMEVQAAPVLEYLRHGVAR